MDVQTENDSTIPVDEKTNNDAVPPMLLDSNMINSPIPDPLDSFDSSLGVQKNGSNLGTALTTIISHFVVSTSGLTQNRVEVLLQLLFELSNCDEEVDTVVLTLQQVLLSLKSEYNNPEEEIVPSLVYDPNNASSLIQHRTNKSNTRAIILEENVVENAHEMNGRSQVNKTMASIFSSQRNTQLSEVNKRNALKYQLCLWCNQIICSSKYKEHSASVHQTLVLLESFTCPICLTQIPDNMGIYSHIMNIPTCICNYVESVSPIKCDLCQETFIGSERIRQHFIKFHKVMESGDPKLRIFWSCLYCGISEHSMVSLSNHIVSYHINQSPHYCRFCGIRYASLTILHRHLIIRHMEKLGDTYNDYCMLVKHNGDKQLTQFVNNDVMCFFCDEELHRESDFRKHVNEVHFCVLRSKYLCVFCNKTFDASRQLKIHVRVDHLNSADKVIDDQSEVEVIDMTPADAGNHNQDSDKSNDFIPLQLPTRPVTMCPICNHKYTNESHFELTHNHLELLKYMSCKLDSKVWKDTIKDDIQLNDMMESFVVTFVNEHNNLRYKCKLCLRIYDDKVMFQVHIKQFHCKIIINSCEWCLMTFESSHKLQKHIRRSHQRENNLLAIPGIPEDMEEGATQDKKDKIKLVDPSKQRKQYLSLHCNECNYTTHRPDYLEEHTIAKHQPERKNQCPKCCSNYSRKRDLRAHLISKHKLQKDNAWDVSEKIYNETTRLYELKYFKPEEENQAVIEVGNIIIPDRIPFNSTPTTESMDISLTSASSDLFSNTDFLDISEVPVMGNLDMD